MPETWEVTMLVKHWKAVVVTALSLSIVVIVSAIVVTLAQYGVI